MIRYISLMVGSLFILSTLLCALDADTILQKMDEVADYTTSKTDAVMKIIDRDGNETTMKLIAYEKRSEQSTKQLMRFTYPARLNGTAVLVVEDSIWYYNKRTNRVRLLSKSAKKGSMMGSSFTYEDISTDYKKEFTAQILDSNKKRYKLKLIPTDPDKKYKYIIAYVNTDNFIAEKMEYFNKNDLKYKAMSASDITVINGHLAPVKIEMTDLETQKITLFEIIKDSAAYDINLPDEMFTERDLKK
ncbi:outer membrane lipoprotein-sorting protein [Thermoproteota archaeon]